jgi:uncharacterized membrane protein
MMDPSAAPSLPPPASTVGTIDPPPDGWAVPAGHGVRWWKSAWQLFTAAPGIWLIVTILYIAIMMGLSLIPLIGQIAVSLLHPVFLGGIVLGCREQDRAGALSVQHLFAGFNEKLGPLVVVALLYFAGWVIIGLATVVLLIAAVGGGAFAALLSGDAAQAGIAVLASLGLSAVLALLVGSLFAIPLLMAFWFAPALIVLRGDEPWPAMTASFRACLRNVPPFLVYGLLGLAFVIVACIPLFLGMLVLIPVGIATVYTSYKDIFGAPA